MAERMTEKRDLGSFSRVSMRGIGKLTINKGKNQEFSIDGDKIAISRITTNVINGQLIIDIGRDWVEKLSAGFDFLSSSDVRIHITLPELEELEVTGAAEVEVSDIQTENLVLRMTGASNVRVQNLKADTLKTEIPGAGKMQVDGKVKEHSLTLAGAGNFSGHDLACKKAKVVLSGVGSAQLWVTDELDVTIAGVGSVEYFGSPSVIQSVTMLGKVSSLGNHP